MTTRTSKSRQQGGRATAVAASVLAFALVVGTTSAEDTSVPPPTPARRVVIGQEYQKGGVHRWLWGDDYRSLWTTPMRVEPLDLHAVAGGLVPVNIVGGRETKALALRGADGRS